MKRSNQMKNSGVPSGGTKEGKFLGWRVSRNSTKHHSWSWRDGMPEIDLRRRKDFSLTKLEYFKDGYRVYKCAVEKGVRTFPFVLQS